MANQSEAAVQSTNKLFCARCNYDLHGQPADGECSECGLSIALSIHNESQDAARAVFVIGCRLLAIYLACTLFIAGYDWMDSLVGLFFPQANITGGAMRVAVTAGINIAGAAALWLLAPVLARLAIPADTPLLARMITPLTLLLVGFGVLGVYFIIGGINTIVSSGFSVLVFEEIHDHTVMLLISQSASSALRVLLGVILLAIARKKWPRGA